MKRIQLIFNILAVVVDFILLVLAGWLAYILRYAPYVQNVRPVIFNLPQQKYLTLVILVALVWVIIFAFVGLYTTTYRERITRELSRVFVGCSLGFMAVITFMFSSRALFSSRFIILVSWILAIIFVSFGRLILRSVRRFLLKRNYGTTNIIVVGRGRTAEKLINVYKHQPVWGFRVVAKVDDISEEKIREAVYKYKVDEIFLADENIGRDERVGIYDFCIQNHLGFRYVADMFDAQAHNVSVQPMGGIPVVEIKKTRLEGWGRIYKRIFDIIVSLLLIILLLPVFLIIIIAIKIDSRGPIIYKNERVGKDGKLFTLYKFRRLKVEYCTGKEYDKDGRAEQIEKELIAKKNQRQGGLYKVINDPRSTRVGRFLEKYSLDELPQLINVLMGNMSLVGPRPHQEREVEKFPKNHERVLAIKPGITGMAQISGRSDLNVDEELRLDTLYIENWSILGDINILIKTPLALFRKRNYT